MHGRHEHADNLFLRLSSYSQRKDRDPLEDFCSEALVWCLRTSADFRKAFFKITGVAYLHDDTVPLVIHSQQRYERDMESNELVSAAGRFDIVIEAEDSSFFVAIESKVGATFGPNQIANYLKRLTTVQKRGEYSKCELLTLTNLREPTDAKVKHLYWGDVHQKLSEVCEGVSTKGRSGDVQGLPIIMQQFSDFLKLKNLAHMTIPTTTPSLLKEVVHGMNLRESMEKILHSLKTTKHLKALLSRKHVVYEPGDETYLGYYGRNEPPFFYVGFSIRHINLPTTELRMYVQCSKKGDQRKMKKRLEAKLPGVLIEAGLEKGHTWFSFEQVVSKEYDGNAEAIREWFNTTTSVALKITQL